MKIAIPTANEKLCMHFGHCETFTIVDVDEEKKRITNSTTIIPPPHEPGVLPKWLSEQGANVIIAGGMGMRAQQLFTQFGIKVVVGAFSNTPINIAESWVKDELTTGENVCDH